MNYLTSKTIQPQTLLVMVVALCLLPFVNKAFHIDDPLFLWAAEQIQVQPFDFYGFSANWYGHQMPMAEINQNPPLTSYYIALVALILNWSEITFHIAFLLPAMGVALGIYQLAIQLSIKPLLSSLIAVSTPVFIVSATTIMSDLLMLAFYLWAMIFWIDGLEKKSLPKLFFACCFITLSALAKYFGLTVIPLLMIYTLYRKPFTRTLPYLFFLTFPLVIMWGYDLLTRTLYQRSLLMEALSYSINIASRDWGEFLDKGLVGLSFSGGCLVTILLMAPFLWSHRFLAAGGVALAILGIWLVSRGEVYGLALVNGHSPRWATLLQLTLYIGGGIHLITLSSVELFRRRDMVALLLFCWVMGTFLFATFLNWTTNARSLLPMLPAIALICCRRFQDCRVVSRKVYIPISMGLAIALLVAWGDSRFADVQREAAALIGQEYVSKGHPVWFMGHWGFQYYMEGQGAKPLETNRNKVRLGDYMVVPDTNTNIVKLNRGYQHVKTYSLPVGLLTTTMREPPVGAGFYASVWGPLPFFIGPVPEEKFQIFRRVDPRSQIRR